MLNIIATDFDRARKELLQEFRALVASDPQEAKQELDATASAMRQLLELEAARA